MSTSDFTDGPPRAPRRDSLSFDEEPERYVWTLTHKDSHMEQVTLFATREAAQEAALNLVNSMREGIFDLPIGIPDEEILANLSEYAPDDNIEINRQIVHSEEKPPITEEEKYPKELCRQLSYWQSGGTSLGCLIYTMCSKTQTDLERRTELKRAWPKHVEVFDRWMRPDGRQWLSMRVRPVAGIWRGRVNMIPPGEEGT